MSMKTTYIFLNSFEEKIVDGVNNAKSEATPESFSTTNNVLQLLGLVLLLLVILIAAYYTSKFLGKYKMGQFKNSNIQVIETYSIGTNKMLQIVKISNKYVVLGISKDSVNYITELDESEVLIHEINKDEKQSFRHIFEKIKGKKE